MLLHSWHQPAVQGGCGAGVSFRSSFLLETVCVAITTFLLCCLKQCFPNPQDRFLRNLDNEVKSSPITKTDEDQQDENQHKFYNDRI